MEIPLTEWLNGWRQPLGACCLQTYLGRFSGRLAFSHDEMIVDVQVAMGWGGM